MSDVEKAIEECSNFLSSLGEDVQCDINPYEDKKAEESGYSLTLSVRRPKGSWYIVDLNHRFPTDGMSVSNMVEDIQRVVKYRMAVGYSLLPLEKAV